MKFSKVMGALIATTAMCIGPGGRLVAGVAFGDDVFNYTIRGEIRALPGEGRAKNELLIRHEAIPEYRDQDGNKVGMEAMTMPFYLEPGVSLEGLKVGDKVQFSLESTIKPSFTEKVTAIKKLE